MINNLFKDLINTIASDIDRFLQSFSGKKVDLDTLANQYEKQILLIAEKTAKQEGMTYAGGIFTIRSVTESRFSYQFSLYFRNTQGDWIEQSGKSREIISTLYLTDEAIKELHEKKEVQYELVSPSHENPSPSVDPAAEAQQEGKNTSTPFSQEPPKKSENISAPNT